MRTWLVALVVLALRAVGLAAQDEEFTSLQWWHGAAAGLGVAALFLAIDEPIRDFVQDHRSETLDDLADVTKRFAEPEVFYIAGGGAIAVGLLSDKPAVTRVGMQIWGAYALSSGMMIATKWGFGRSRPSTTPDDPTEFDWFNGGQNNAFPSGSAAVVFSLATTVSDAVGKTPVSVALYSGAVLNSWARLNADRHWLSDVAVGALYGITAAKLVNGRWRVFGLRPPSVLVGLDRSTTIQYGFRF